MQKKHKDVLFGSLQIMTVSAFLCALSIICGKYLAIPVGNILRFSFENTPILFAGIMFGPIVGAVVGAVADLVGCIMVGYVINPIVTLGAVSIGLIGGLGRILTKKLPLSLSVAITVVSAHLAGSVIIKTFGLAKFYSMPFMLLMVWRALNYLIIAIPEFLILYYLSKSKSVTSQIEKLKKR
ncbi:MAG: folate family ECF transporter S component [Clostridia bacterium]|nr:folate family ECF transporter S component [Clostridia bacterium]